MKPMLTLTAVICAIMAFAFFQTAKSAVHEILAAIMWLSAIIAAAAAAICSRLDRLLHITQREGDNSWNIGVAIWRQLREPGKHPEPEPQPEGEQVAENSESAQKEPTAAQQTPSESPPASRWLLIIPIVVLAAVVIGAIIRANGVVFWFER